ncbi:MAG: hypothetical protein QG640_212 [Patescibacteria group bacterium]|nr:hypothetical protein [Patescibacteria group bacterium]
MNKLLKNKGFTIVETLVAIAILMIAIAGPLTIAQKGLMASVYARDQSVATFLAQDAMEYLKNTRDNTPSSAATWLDNINESGSICTSSSNLCSIDTLNDGSAPAPCSISPTNTCILNHDETTSGYGPGGNGSQFSRGFYVTEIQPDVEAKVVVIVWWTNGTIQNAVTLENYFFNVQL